MSNGLLNNLAALPRGPELFHTVFPWRSTSSSPSHKDRQLASICTPLGAPNLSLKVRGLLLCPKLNLQYVLIMNAFIFVGSPSGNHSVPLLTSNVTTTGKFERFKVSFHLSIAVLAWEVYSS